jgi:hypothetical protein
MVRRNCHRDGTATGAQVQHCRVRDRKLPENPDRLLNQELRLRTRDEHPWTHPQAQPAEVHLSEHVLERLSAQAASKQPLELAGGKGGEGRAVVPVEPCPGAAQHMAEEQLHRAAGALDAGSLEQGCSALEDLLQRTTLPGEATRRSTPAAV